MKTDPDKTLVVLVGPTASGKTGLAIQLAKYYKTEIISADSRQFYKEIPIGTAAPSAEEMAGIKHHFVGHLSIQETYNVYRFEQDVLRLTSTLYQTNDVVIMTGGSGLYLDAVCYGIDELPDPDPVLREQLEKRYRKEGIEVLQQELQQLDPEYYATVDKNNSKRLIRAIEVCKQTGKTYSEQRKKQQKHRPFNILKLGLELPRELLNERIHQRTEMMLKAGWLEEAKTVYPLHHLNALKTVGYKELFNYFSGDCSLQEAVEKIKTNTRRYAKRQMTWFRKDENIKWFSPSDVEGMIQYLNGAIEGRR